MKKQFKKNKQIKMKRRMNIFYAALTALILSFTFLGMATSLSTRGEFVSRLYSGTLNSSVSGNVMTVNDLENDYYYYIGQNYTHSDNSSLPTKEDKNLYNNSNLVQVKITYHGENIENTKRGYVSTTENVDTLVYYKAVPLKTNNSIEIELIDNTFTNRPNNQGFNGWVTDYNGAVTRYDDDYYVRYVEVPVTFSGGVPDTIEIDMYAAWANANVATITSNNATGWNNAFSQLRDKEMIGLGGTFTSHDELTQYYTRTTVARRSNYPTGAVNSSGTALSGTCNTIGGCTVYVHPTQNVYDPNATYYNLVASTSGWGRTTYSMQEVDVHYSNYTTEYLDEGTILAGYYRQVNVNRGGSLSGLYDKYGVYQNGGTCGTNGGCTYYELIQYKTNGTVNIADGVTKYYEMTTRDMNIIVMRSSISTAWSTSNNKPFTLTSVYNGTDSRGSASFTVSNIAVKCYNDTVLENIYIYSSSTRTTGSVAAGSGTNTSGMFYGNRYNVKIGRGITKRNGNYLNFSSAIGGNNAAGGSSSDPIKYRFIVESGYYNALAVGDGGGGTIYVKSQGIFGCDYDRVINDNDNLYIYYSFSSSFGGTYNLASTNDVGFDNIFKSGTYGGNKSGAYAGIYVGGRNGGTHNVVRRGKIEGGVIYSLIGGPIAGTGHRGNNDCFIYVTGGEIDMIFGGAGESATYGNRIIQVTGGTVNYSVFGGSNGYSAGNGDGTIVGSSYVYIGGNAVIGSTTHVNNNDTLYGAEAGSVFGIGNGNSNYDTIGSNDNSIIVIADKATINRNVYGGGNYSSVGMSSSSNTTTTDLIIVGGHVKGSVYGGGNNNGSGSSSKQSTVTINMTGGVVDGAIYGGSNQKGTIYGSVQLNMYGGTVGSIYGGGLGGYRSSSSVGTFVQRNVDIVIGSATLDTIPKINGNVYGGSSFGTVNSASNSTVSTSYHTYVTVNTGTISGSVFGGGQGSSTYTPKVDGNILVTINSGSINSVFGGNDQAGKPSGSCVVVVNNGTVGNVFGGGNQTDLNKSDVTINNGLVDYVYGGSNQAGTVTNSNVKIVNGTLVDVYGGNNAGGQTTNSTVTVTGGSMNEVYGGGKSAVTTTTNVAINGATISNVFGGGKSAGVSTSASINITNGSIGTIYGGSNESGTVVRSTINATGGTANTVFGGNNAGGQTTLTNVTVNGIKVTDVYGGGKQADSGTTNVTVTSTNGTISNVYGGGKSAGVSTSASVNVTNGNIGTIYGGSNESGTVARSTINATGGTANTVFGGNNAGGQTTLTNVTVNGIKVTDVYGGGKQADSGTTNVTVTSTNGTINNVFGGGQSASAQNTNVAFNGGNANYLFGGSNQSGTVSSASVVTSAGSLGTVYGGNNAGGQTTNARLDLGTSTVNYVYGGGNEAITSSVILNMNNTNVTSDVYGGGNAAAILNNTSLTIVNSNVGGNLYGGGNAGEVNGNTSVYVSSGTVEGSLYAGGNGVTAIVSGDTLMNIDGGAYIGTHVFGGGNAAATGEEEEDNSTSIVNIVGATIDGSVYGGANTSVLYGETFVNIGYDAVGNEDLIKDDVIIHGTVFGGGEANAAGSDNYDYTFISVTKGINIKIDGNGHDEFDIDGSIFGSGNASSSGGYSYIDINNYGTFDDYKNNVSIQRANIVTISNSALELVGATDRTNDYSNVLFSLSRIDELRLVNNSTLFMQNGSNLLQKFVSGTISDGTFTKASVDIDDENQTVTKNVDNRIYLQEGVNLNVATSQNVTSYGDVEGMTFFGMYSYDRFGKVWTAMYAPSYEYGDVDNGNDFYYFTLGSYVLGKHKSAHNIERDGFYSNFNVDDAGVITVKYIDPVPDDKAYYMWVVGEQIASYEIEMIASKYITLGTQELPLINHADPNTIFSIVGVNFDDLDSNVTLVDEYDIPRIASSSSIADNVIGLSITNSNSGWVTEGKTSFLTEGSGVVTGTTTYERNNTSVMPSLVLYLYHSKNIGSAGAMGKITISMLVTTPIDDLNNKVERVNIVITLSRALYNTSDYESTITTGKRYEMFAASDVNVTNKGSFSAYYSLFIESETNPYKAGYYRSLVTDYVFPENTKITMIDKASSDVTDYYYYIVTASDVAAANSEYALSGEASYRLDKFTRMGSTDASNTYSDTLSNTIYYDSSLNSALEEFIFIVDLGESGINENVLDKKLLIELRDGNNNDNVVVSVLGFSQMLMNYNIYVQQDAVIDVDGVISTSSIYPGENPIITVTTNVIRNTSDDVMIEDTSFDNQKLGIKITLFDSNGVQVTGTSLFGTTFTYNGIVYYPRVDGTTRINLADKVTNVAAKLKMYVANGIAAGSYNIVIESFGSYDGVYYGLTSSDSVTIPVQILNTSYGLSVDMADEMMIIEKSTGNTLNGDNLLSYTLNYESNLHNPNIKISLYRRNYDSIYSLDYEIVDLQRYFSSGYIPNEDYTYEYILLSNPQAVNNLSMRINSGMDTGTYKLVFSMYDGNVFIGNVYKYILIKESGGL